MRLDEIDDPDQLKRINAALMNRVETVLDQQGNSFSLFQTALSLEGQVRRRTDELTNAMHRMEQINEELALAKEAAEQANRSKTSFLAAASHDVLQPLNAAILSMSVLGDVQTTRQGHELVQQVERSLETMSRLLSTLLDISRLDAGVMQPSIEAVPLDPLFDALRSDFEPIAAGKGLKLTFRPSGAVVASDATMLRRILQNLVSNALRYTSKGGVLVAARRRGNIASIEVHDTGHGICESMREQVFQEFHRGNIAPGYAGEEDVGLGLGLSIVKRMAATLDHPLQLKSKTRRGTTFRICARLQASADMDRVGHGSDKAGSALACLEGTRVLLLENDRSVAEAMMRLLMAWQCGPICVATGKDAITMLQRRKWRPDIIIADQHLDNEERGTDAVANVWSTTGDRCPVIIATGKPCHNLDQTVRRLGVEVLVKPIKPGALRALMSHLINSVRTS